MASKLKVTGFTRFLLAMLFIVPMAYLIASYANGEDGLGKIKEAVGLDTPNSKTSTATRDADCASLQQQVERQAQRIRQLERENKKLRTETVTDVQ